jgi:hypothetical protein
LSNGLELKEMLILDYNTLITSFKTLSAPTAHPYSFNLALFSNRLGNIAVAGPLFAGAQEGIFQATMAKLDPPNELSSAINLFSRTSESLFNSIKNPEAIES